MCKPAPGLPPYYYVPLALFQPRDQGAQATLFILSQNWGSPSRLPSTAQAAAGYHLKNCQIAQATAVLGKCWETMCTNAGQAPRSTFASVVFSSTNTVLAARTRPTVYPSLETWEFLHSPVTSPVLDTVRWGWLCLSSWDVLRNFIGKKLICFSYTLSEEKKKNNPLLFHHMIHLKYNSAIKDEYR